MEKKYDSNKHLYSYRAATPPSPQKKKHNKKTKTKQKNGKKREIQMEDKHLKQTNDGHVSMLFLHAR